MSLGTDRTIARRLATRQVIEGSLTRRSGFAKVRATAESDPWRQSGVLQESRVQLSYGLAALRASCTKRRPTSVPTTRWQRSTVSSAAGRLRRWAI
jgi:hypothetical protein